jgi:transcriptional regulator with XRE-family HTH domain
MDYESMQETVNQRLNILVDSFEKGKKAAFARKVGISPQAAQEILAGRQSEPSFRVLVKILESYPQVCSDWLVLGQGPMLRDRNVQLAESNPTISPENLLSINEMQAQTERMQRAFQLVQRALGAVTDAALSPEQAKQLKKDFPDSFPAAE